MPGTDLPEMPDPHHNRLVLHTILHPNAARFSNHTNKTLSRAKSVRLDRKRPVSGQNPLERFKTGRQGQLSFSAMVDSNLVNFYLMRTRVTLAPYPS
jgi:hypothetical protein